ncbi:hypothetical protein [Sporisorium scitamineum]|uniref:Uncharacterized protein n=1 Tax=Sporisorium scitamineum TaxID=49012 RepID=A0A0F7RZ32_9BASI|nr:hypothetical protein [Sporisorium scitamineum]
MSACIALPRPNSATALLCISAAAADPKTPATVTTSELELMCA